MKNNVQSKYSKWYWWSFLAFGMGAIALLLTPVDTCACGDYVHQFMGSMLRTQQAHWLETGKFIPSLAAVPSSLSLTPHPDYEHSFQVSEHWAIVSARPKPVPWWQVRAPRRFAYLGMVQVRDRDTVVMVCKAERPGAVPLEPPQLPAKELRCPAGSRPI